MRLRVLGWPAFKNRAVNPYNWLLYTHLRQNEVEVDEFSPIRLLLGRYNVWHVHWPEFGLSFAPTWRAALWALVVLILVGAARARRIRLIWTVHNLGTHETTHPRLEALFWRLFLPGLDGFVALSEAGLKLARQRFPVLRNRRGFVIRHGHYRGAYPDVITQAEARSLLGLADARVVITFFGQLRPYKNVPGLVRAFRGTTDPNARLVVAGDPHSPTEARQIRDTVGADSRVQVRLGAIPDSEVQVYLRAATLVVLPYTEILNSGSALLALSFDRPVLVPERGPMVDLQTQAGSEWVRTFPGELNSHVLSEAVDWALHTPRKADELRHAFCWRNIAQETHRAYQDLCSPTRT